MKIIRKMGRGVGKGAKFFFNFPRWMGLKEITTSGKGITATAKVLLQKPQAAHQETFNEAVRRLHLSETDVQAQMKTFFQAALIYAAIAVALLGYAVYLLFNQYLAAAFLSFVLCVLALTFAFRQHFYYFQMKQRRLGCTIKEWMHFLLGEK